MLPTPQSEAAAEGAGRRGTVDRDMGAHSLVGSAPGSPRRHPLVDAAETTSTSVSDERTRSGEDATGSSSSGVDGGEARARGEARREKHERHAFPVVRSDPVSHLRAKYRVGKAVGKGGYAVVYKGARVSDGLRVAVKKVDIRDMPDKKRERCLREVQLLGNVTHGNVVRMLDSFLDDRYLVIVFEWADGGDLRRFVRARREAKKPLDEPEIWTVFAQIVDALAHLHRRDVGVAHRDVKPANVLVVNGVVKLADLGLGKRVDEGDASSENGEKGASAARADGGMRSKVGTPYYVAPEIVRGDVYGLASDVWSLGCLLYELAALRSPFEMTGPGADVKHVFRRIGKHEFAPLTENGRHSRALVALTTSMLDADPARRPTMETIRETCQLARASFDAVDRLGPTRGVYAAAERVCDRLALLSARGFDELNASAARASAGARPKPGTLELALGQPGVFVEASPNETDRARFARVARLAAWLLRLARFAPAEDSATDFAFFDPERAKRLAAALEAYADGEADPQPADPKTARVPADGAKKSSPSSVPATPAKPPEPPPGPAPSAPARSSPRRLRDAARASASAEASGESAREPPRGFVTERRQTDDGETRSKGAPPGVAAMKPASENETGEKKRAVSGKKASRLLPAPPLAALRSSALAPPSADESRRFALAVSLTDAARACAGVDADAFAEKLRFASPASVARGHGWAAVTALSALSEAAFAALARASPPRRARETSSRAGSRATAAAGKPSRDPAKENENENGAENTPAKVSKDSVNPPSARVRRSLTLTPDRDVGSGSPEAAAVEEEPHVAGAVAPSPESDRKPSERTDREEARSPSRRPTSRAMRAAATARTRLAARNSWQRVFDPDAGAPAGGVVKVAR